MIGSLATSTAAAKCKPTPITKGEAVNELKLMGYSLEVRQSGKSVSTVDWRPLSGYRVKSFFLFLVMAPKDQTPMENGIVGYYGVNKWTADVLEQNEDGTFETSGPLRRYQNFLRKKHCLSTLLNSKRLGRLEGQD
ncbi:MAG: hypothetical protein ABIO86_11790 [Sphingomonas sp.]